MNMVMRCAYHYIYVCECVCVSKRWLKSFELAKFKSMHTLGMEVKNAQANQHFMVSFEVLVELLLPQATVERISIGNF